MSEWILNSASAQLGYTVPFTLVHVRKYRTEDKSTVNTETKHNQETVNKAKHSKIKLHWFTTLGQETRWAYFTTLPSPQFYGIIH